MLGCYTQASDMLTLAAEFEGSAVRHSPPAPLNAALTRLFQRLHDAMDGGESSVAARV